MSIVVKNVHQEFKKGNGVNLVLKDINLTIDKPSINMLMGPSGSGKSTLMRMMGGVRPIDVKTPTSGSVTLFDKEIGGHSPDVMTVFQQYVNRPDMTVFQNVEMPFTFKLWKDKYSKSQQKEIVNRIINEVGLSDKRDLYPHQLSGGQNQRVALARALVTSPRVILMDEPFGALDHTTRDEMQKLLIRIQEIHKMFVVFITHDVQEALTIGDRIIVLSSGPASIVEDIVLDEPKPRQLWFSSAEANKAKSAILRRLNYSKSVV